MTEVLCICYVLPWLSAPEGKQLLQMMYPYKTWHMKSSCLEVLKAKFTVCLLVLSILLKRYFGVSLNLCSLSCLKENLCHCKKCQCHTWCCLRLRVSAKEPFACVAFFHREPEPVPHVAFYPSCRSFLAEESAFQISFCKMNKVGDLYIFLLHMPFFLS